MKRKEKSSLTLNEIANWIERNRQGFYLGCRVDEHSPQINEFCRALIYYLEKDFGYKPQVGEK